MTINGLSFLIARHAPVDLVEQGRLEGLALGALRVEPLESLLLALRQLIALFDERPELVFPRADRRLGGPAPLVARPPRRLALLALRLEVRDPALEPAELELHARPLGRQLGRLPLGDEEAAHDLLPARLLLPVDESCGQKAGIR